jgi:molybdate transport system substrate-binding protein
MHRTISTAARLGLAMMLFQPVVTHADEIRIFCTRNIAMVLEKVGPEFERATGHKLNVTTDVSTRMVRRVQAGEPFDILVAAPGQIDALIKDGKIRGETRANLVRSGIGVEVRAGASRPDISSVDAFKRALLNAKSIGYLREGMSGIYLSTLLERLGVAEAIKSKVTRPETDIVSELVAKGELELGMVVIPQILTTPGVELVGPLPAEIQSYITFAAGVSANAPAPGGAKDLLKFLKGPSSITVIRSQGMEPG